jgi:hypothetical protein
MISRAIKKGWTMITIKKKTVEKRPGGRDWKVVEQRPYTKEELADAGAHFKDELKRIYDYTPEIEVSTIVETEILRQVIEDKDFDFTAVVKAINKLG